MLKHLRKIRTATLNNRAYSVGLAASAPDDALRKCRPQMCACQVLVLQAIREDFPEWGWMQAFGMMNLRESRRAHDMNPWIARLSKVVDVPEHALRSEFPRLLPVALHWKSSHPRAKNLACWRAAMQEVRGYPTMEKALLFYAVFHGCTTTQIMYYRIGHVLTFLHQTI